MSNSRPLVFKIPLTSRLPKRCVSSRGNLPKTSSESNIMNREKMKKKHKPLTQVTMEAKKADVQLESIVSKAKPLTGREFKFQLKRKLEKGTEPEELALGKSEKLIKCRDVEERVQSASSKMKRHVEEHVHSASSKKKRHIEENVHVASKKKRRLKKKYLQCSPDKIDSGRDLMLADGDNSNETSNADKGRLPVVSVNLKILKSTTEENCANEEHCEDRIPLQQKLSLENTSCESDEGNGVNKIQQECDKRMKNLMKKQKRKIQKFHRDWEEKMSKVNEGHKLEAAIIRVIHGKSSATMDKLMILDDKFAKKVAEDNFLKDSKLKDLEVKHLAKRNYESKKAAEWLSEAKAYISGELASSCKAWPLGSEDEEVSGCSESRTHILGAKDLLPLTGQHGENNNSTRTVLGKHVVQSNNSDCATAEGVGCNASNRNPSNLISSSKKNEGGISFSDISIPAVVEQSNQPKHFGDGESICFNLPASGERVPGEMQSLELHGGVAAELPETVVNAIVDCANPVDLGTYTPIEGFGERDAIDLPDAEQLTQPKHFGSGQRIFANLPASGERVPGEMQSLQLSKDIPAELSSNTSLNGFGEGDAIDLPDPLLNQRNETDETTIDDLDLAGQVLKTSEQTKASPQPCPLLLVQVQEDQDLMSAKIHGHVNSFPPEVVVSVLVDTATKFLSNIPAQDREEPALETQSSARIEVATSKIIDTVIAEPSSIKLQVKDASVVEDQVTLQIEVSDLEASVANSELVGTAQTLQSNSELQDQVEPAIETQSTSGIEVAASENMNNTTAAPSSTELQDEDALIVNNQVSLEIAVSNSGLADIATPVQSHIDEPAIENCEQLQLMPIDASPSYNQFSCIELESQRHNPGRISSGAAETEMPSQESTPQLREDVEPQSNYLDVGPESQSSHETSVEISATFQISAEAVLSTIDILHRDVLQLGGVSHLPGHEVAAWNSPSLFADPLQNELERSYKENEELQKNHENTMEWLKSECAKEMQELVAAVQNKYELKREEAQAQFRLKQNGLSQNQNKILKNKLLANAFSSNCSSFLPTRPLMQQGSPSSSMHHQLLFMRPAGATARQPASNLQIANLNGQTVQQISVPVPPSTRISSAAGQIYAAPPVQAAQHAAAISSFTARPGVLINDNHPTSNPRFGGDIHSSAPHFQAWRSFLLNLQQQQQQRPSSSQIPQHLGCPPALLHTCLSALDVEQRPLLPGNHANSSIGSLQQSYFDTLGNQISCAAATSAICLSDDD